jgi:phage FluMu protein gp41
MIAIADSKHRVTLRRASPGDRFDVQILEEGKYVLTRLEPAKPRISRVRFVKRNGYTVGVSDQPVSAEAIHAALDEFP